MKTSNLLIVLLAMVLLAMSSISRASVCDGEPIDEITKLMVSKLPVFAEGTDQEKKYPAKRVKLPINVYAVTNEGYVYVDFQGQCSVVGDSYVKRKYDLQCIKLTNARDTTNANQTTAGTRGFGGVPCIVTKPDNS